MITYRRTRDPHVVHNELRGHSFPTRMYNRRFKEHKDSPPGWLDHPEWIECQELVKAGKAQLLPFEEPTVEVKRRQAYQVAGVTDHEMVVALWELIVDGDDELVAKLKAKREEIKNRIK